MPHTSIAISIKSSQVITVTLSLTHLNTNSYEYVQEGVKLYLLGVHVARAGSQGGAAAP